MQKILIVDDHEKIREMIKEHLINEGYECLTAKSGSEALEVFFNEQVHMVLLDIMMSGMDGIEVCREIRKYSQVPIIMISAKGEEEERILGLDSGADDYITKPFGVKEVLARIRALTRRTGIGESQVITCKDLVIDRVHHITYISGYEVILTKKEEMLLALLASSPGKVFSRDVIMHLAWQHDSESSDRAVDTHVKRIRAKIDTYPHPGFAIKTIWGIGYKLEVYD